MGLMRENGALRLFLNDGNGRIEKEKSTTTVCGEVNNGSVAEGNGLEMDVAYSTYSLNRLMGVCSECSPPPRDRRKYERLPE